MVEDHLLNACLKMKSEKAGNSSNEVLYGINCSKAMETIYGLIESPE